MDHKTNKYTIKLINFLNDNFRSYYDLIDCENNKIISLIRDTYNKASVDEISLKKSEKIKKIHEYNDKPLIYLIMVKLLNDGLLNKTHKPVTTNFKKFVDWYRENHSLLDLKRYLRGDKKYNTYYGLLYNPPANRKELHSLLYDNMFVSLDVLHHAESENLNYSLYENDNTEVHLYVPENDENPDINVILKIFSFFRALTNDKDKFIKLVVFYGNQKKYLPMNSSVICPDNVNSGATMKGVIITIWRREEFYKVLIHELVHYFDLDFYVTDSIYKKLDKYTQDNVTIKGIDRVNESYAEILAVTIHSVIYSVIMNISVDKILSTEMLYSCLQFAKIFNFFGYDDCNMENKRINVHQTTSVWSYYIIKCMFLLNYDKILKFWEENGFSILNDFNSENNYEKTYKSIYLNSSHINKINGIIKSIKDNKSGFAANTMRMTLYQLQ